MRKSRFKDEQIVAMLRETDRDAVPVVAKRDGVSGQPISGHCLAREARYSVRVMLRPLDLGEPIISHAGFCVRLCDG
jgi:hypothetical protein